MASTSGYSSPAKGSSAATAANDQRAGAGAAAGGPHQRAVLGDRRRRAARRPAGRAGRRGFTASTIAITTNSATSVSFGKAIAMPPISTVPSTMHSALVTPISSAARNAPGIEPRPPTTVTTKASAMMARSMPRFAGSRGSCSAPASPARQAPSANTSVNSRASSMPSAPTSTRFSVAARISMPKRVRVSSHHSATEHQRPDGDQQQVVGRHRAAEDVDDAGEARRARSQQVLGAPDRERRVADDQHDAEGRRELQQLRRGVDPAQQQRSRSARRPRRPRPPPARRRPRSRRGPGRATRRATTRGTRPACTASRARS